MEAPDGLLFAKKNPPPRMLPVWQSQFLNTVIAVPFSNLRQIKTTVKAVYSRIRGIFAERNDRVCLVILGKQSASLATTNEFRCVKRCHSVRRLNANHGQAWGLPYISEDTMQWHELFKDKTAALEFPN